MYYTKNFTDLVIILCSHRFGEHYTVYEKGKYFSTK